MVALDGPPALPILIGEPGLPSCSPPMMPEPSEPGLWALIREDLSAHEGDWYRPGFRALLAYRFGVWRMSVNPKLLRAPLSVLYRWMFRRANQRYGIELPYSASIGRRVVFEHQHGIVIHGSSAIGDDCIIRQGVTLGNRHLQRPFDAPTLGRGVSIGAGAVLLGAITVGDGAAVGANAVVLDDVEPGQTVVGIPARPMHSESNGGELHAGPGAEPRRAVT